MNSCPAKDFKAKEESFFGADAERLVEAGLIRHCEDCEMFHIVYGWDEIDKYRSEHG